MRMAIVGKWLFRSRVAPKKQTAKLPDRISSFRFPHSQGTNMAKSAIITRTYENHAVTYNNEGWFNAT